MTAPGIVAVEGGVCAGKTTLVDRLGNGDGIFCLPEYVEWIRSSGRTLPLGTPEERLRAYLAIEEERERVARHSDHTVLLDRSILTLIGFEYAMRRMWLGTAWFSIRTLVSSYRIMAPSGVIIADVDAGLQADLWAELGLSHQSLFVNRRFNDSLRWFFDEIEAFVPILRVSPVTTDETALSSTVLSFIEKSTACPGMDIVAFVESLDVS